MQRTGTNWSGKVKSVNKGGAVVDVNGLRGFIPWSRMDPAKLQPPDSSSFDTRKLVGTPVSAKVIQVSHLRVLLCSHA